MRERRVHSRYDVSEASDFRAAIVGGPLGERLMTMSVGGCGFWAPSEQFNLQANQRVRVLFLEKSQRDALELRGQILYVLPHPIESRVGKFYGIKFHAEEQTKLEGILGKLEELLRAGQVRLA